MSSELAQKTRKGDTQAFEAFCVEVEPLLFTYALRLSHNRADAEDIAQEALFRLYKALRTGKSIDEPRAYAFRIAHNLMAEMVRKGNRRRVELSPTPAPAPAASAERALLRQQIDLALKTLPADQREALLLREFGGMNYRTIAETLGATLDQVKVWIHRGRKALARVLDEDGQYTGPAVEGSTPECLGDA